MEHNKSSKYKMTISPNVLNHLGLNLYSNTPAVLAEVVANAWDADATEVEISFNVEKDEILIKDNGSGMDTDDINEKFLFVGYRKREHIQATPIKKRPPMGRKGIGNLSLFSIANKIYVYSKSADNREALLMDADAIKENIKRSEEGNRETSYLPKEIEFDDMVSYESGTTIKIADLKKNITQATVKGLRKRMARRFSVISEDFNVIFEGEPITYADRGYFDKARFLFQYNADYSLYCKNLDEDDGKKQKYDRPYQFDKSGNSADGGEYEIKGWIAIAQHSNDLDGEGDDNLNNIAIVVRGKVAQEDILHEFRMGGMITKFMYGEIHAEFLDSDKEDDIATSGRQKIIEDDPRCKALKAFIEKELKYIWSATNTLKEKKGLESAFNANSLIKEWYDQLKPLTQKQAQRIFGVIEKISTDDSDKKTLYINAILAFEKSRMREALGKLENIDENNVKELLSFFDEIDDIEAEHYRAIVEERLRVIGKLNKHTKDNVRERVLQEYLFDHLWLFDPAWERATTDSEMEKVVKGVEHETNLRLDVTYKTVSGNNVIIELKKPARSITKLAIEEQLKKYIDAVKAKLNSQNADNLKVQGICLVGKLPKGWDNRETREQGEKSLEPYNITVMTYDELIKNAHSAYRKFIEKRDAVTPLRKLIDSLKNSD